MVSQSAPPSGPSIWIITEMPHGPLDWAALSLATEARYVMLEKSDAQSKPNYLHITDQDQDQAYDQD